jgi:DNA end-binding protein Ku
MARGLWSGSVSFGLLNIPVVIFSSKEDERISFRMLDKRDTAPVGYKQINKSTGREIDRKNIVKGYEYEKNKFVIIDKEEIEKANPRATQTIDIEDFVDLADLDVLMFEKPYYLAPGKNGHKGYVLLHKVLQETDKVAICKFVIHNRQHLAAIFPKGDYLILESLRFAHEVQDVDSAEFFDVSTLKKVKITPKELKMAKDLVAGMTSKWKPEHYKDTYQDDLMKLINQKIKTGEVEEGEPVEDTRPATSDTDIMKLLEQSLKTHTQPHKSKPKKPSSGRHLH